jgi:hypothetical protein
MAKEIGSRQCALRAHIQEKTGRMELFATHASKVTTARWAARTRSRAHQGRTTICSRRARRLTVSQHLAQSAGAHRQMELVLQATIAHQALHLENSNVLLEPTPTLQT